jgi:hypothetical protein
MEMRLISKGLVITSAGSVLLGTSLWFSSAGAVSGASALPTSSGHPSPAKKSCDTKKYCLTENNQGSGGGILAEGYSYGVNASASQTGGIAVQGQATGNNSAGVYGLGGPGASSQMGIGVYGFDNNAASAGVVGGGTAYGVYGNGTVGVGVYGTGPGYGGTGVAGTGSATFGRGVYGTASASGGIGVYGVGGPGNDYGDGGGVYGQDSGYGTYGVEGYDLDGFAAVYAEANSGIAVYANAGSSIAGEFDNNSNASSTYTVETYNNGNGGLLSVESGAGEFTVDNGGDGDFTGSVSAKSFKTVLLSEKGEKLAASVPAVPQPTVEDTGTARLSNGEGAVRFDPAFASTIDASRGYQVFLTPNGETRGWLYVAAKYERGFIVREGLRGRSSVEFDYRVVARPIGSDEPRFAQYVPPSHPKVIKLPPTQPPARPRLVTPALPHLSGGN